MPDDVDLSYTEVAVHEPSVDVWRVLSPHGLAGSASPAMLAALRSLGSAAEDPQRIERLHEIHRLAANELPVIPLWQIQEHFAYHASAGLTEAPRHSLYDDVEAWQAQLRPATE
jgi:peptide/nickel transport system substrate-binding protein